MNNMMKKIIGVTALSVVSIATLHAYSDGRRYRDQFGNDYYAQGGCPGGRCAAPSYTYDEGSSQGYYQGPSGYYQNSSNNYQGGNPSQGNSGYYQNSSNYYQGGNPSQGNSGYYQNSPNNSKGQNPSQGNSYSNPNMNNLINYNDSRFTTKSDPTNSTETAVKSDNTIEQDIISSIKKDPGMSVYAQKIQATSKNGNVTLTGRVADISEKAKIETLANHTSGVKQVTNNLEVKK